MNLESIRLNFFTGRLGAILSKVYGAIVSLRNFLYDQNILPSYKSSLEVISVGNITAGGNGKTPLVIHLVKKYLSEGKRPVVLSRGYGGKLAGPLLVSENHRSGEVGDEPLLIFQKTCVPVVVSRDRVAGAKFIEKEKIGDLIVLDDGFQHRRLKRDLDIVTINLTTEEDLNNFRKAELLPKGLFREPRDSALVRASEVVLISRSTKPVSVDKINKVKALLPKNITIKTAHLAIENLAIPPQRIFAFTAIANPEGFFETLNELGFQVEQMIRYPDHHQFTPNELNKLITLSEGKPVVCTAKDFIKITEIEVQSKIFALKSEIVLSG